MFLLFWHFQFDTGFLGSLDNVSVFRRWFHSGRDISYFMMKPLCRLPLWGPSHCSTRHTRSSSRHLLAFTSVHQTRTTSFDPFACLSKSYSMTYSMTWLPYVLTAMTSFSTTPTLIFRPIVRQFSDQNQNTFTEQEKPSFRVICQKEAANTQIDVIFFWQPWDRGQMSLSLESIEVIDL